jgi:hypothetical protein
MRFFGFAPALAYAQENKPEKWFRSFRWFRDHKWLCCVLNIKYVILQSLFKVIGESARGIQGHDGIA